MIRNFAGTAAHAVEEMPDLVGRTVITEAVGDWPGGIATVTELAPDPGATEIAFNVHSEQHGDVGVFEDEWVEVFAFAATERDNG